MAQKRIQQQLPIPSDWTEETDGFLVKIACCPNSVQWSGIFDGALYNLAQGRTWKASTGTITTAQTIGRGIFNSIMTCDIQTDLARIATALEGIETLLSAGLGVDPQLTDLKPYMDELEELGQEIARSIGGVTIPITEMP